MLITNPLSLKSYTTENRIWQGIPSIEVTEKGRIFLTFYSGGTREDYGNYVMLIKSDDDGKTFSEPIAVAYKDENHRCYDPALWIDPLGRLWFIWAVMPANGVFASICDNPDADELVFSEPRKIGEDVMMCRPTVLSTGEWLFPIAVWRRGLVPHTWQESKISDAETGAFLYKTTDHGKTFTRLGGARVNGRSFDEHMSLELSDGRIRVFVRTGYGIGAADSYDRGKTFGESFDTGYGGPCSRFHITRLSSGRLLMINHFAYTGRNNLYAMLSEDEGKTWKYKLLLDERNEVSYPDAVERNGYIHITYDRERGGFMGCFESAYSKAREVLVAKITEEDIINGSLCSDGYLKRVASKLGKYCRDDVENPYLDLRKYTSADAAKQIMKDHPKEKYISVVFNAFSVNCTNMHKVDCDKLDELISRLESGDGYADEILEEIITLVKGVTETTAQSAPIVDRIKQIIEDSLESDISIAQVAEKAGMSKHYMSHVFKKSTAITVVEYKNELKLTKAKKLLVTTDDSVTDIAYACGFSSASYFAERFAKSEGMLPLQYRNLNKK
ncbi:MAG: exo-alpha-sialidase [Clostridia bacterium]|nr:exo-alpha-sialidase [Clostridia bacterium]